MPDGLCAWCSLCGAEISDRMRIVNGHSYCRQCGSPVQYINIDALLREVKHYFQQATEYQQESARLKDEVSRLQADNEMITDEIAKMRERERDTERIMEANARLQAENDRLRGEVIVSDCLLRDVVKRVYDAASLEQRYGSESRSRAFPLLADKIRCVLAGKDQDNG